MPPRTRNPTVALHRVPSVVGTAAASRNICQGKFTQGLYPDTLPFDAVSAEFVVAVRSNDVVLVKGETGSGKSTRAPAYCLDNCNDWGEHARILTTEPRRLAATALAARVAEERGDRLSRNYDSSVGYMVRKDCMMPQPARCILFSTEGRAIHELKRCMLAVPAESSAGDAPITHVFIDEAHERNVNTDYLLYLCKQMLEAKRPIKVVVLSATLDATEFRQYFDGFAVAEFHVAGQSFPVDHYFLGDPSVPNFEEPHTPAVMIPACMDWVTQIGHEGHMLIFLDGAPEIAEVQDSLEHPTYTLVSLHGSLTMQQQEEIMCRAKSPEPRLGILATNIAETSLTVPNVGVVIDFAKAKIRMIDSLRSTRISKASVYQRRGRTGREMSGLCLTVLTRAAFDKLQDTATPEMQRIALDTTILQLLEVGLAHFTAEGYNVLQNFIAVPERREYDRASKQLERLGATHNGVLTALGAKLVQFTPRPEVALSLVVGALLGVLHHTALTLAAAMNHRLTTQAWQLWKWHGKSSAGSDMRSDLFTVAACLEHFNWRSDPHASGLSHGSSDALVAPAVLRETLAEAKGFIQEAESFLEIHEDPRLRWLEDAWPLVDFAIMCGFRRAALSSPEGKFIEDMDGSKVKLTNCGFRPEKNHAYTFVEEHNGKARGLHTVRPLAYLVTAPGPLIVTSHDTVASGRFLELSVSRETCERLMPMRNELICILSEYIRQACTWHRIHLLRGLCSANEGFGAFTRLLPRAPIESTVTWQPQQPKQAPPNHLVLTPRVDPAVPLATPCQTPLADLPACRSKHLPKAKQRRTDPKYLLFQAAQEKCLRCVRQRLEVEPKNDPNARSDTYAWSVRDYAAFSEAKAIVQYLDAQWPGIPRATTLP